jgi:hypothetical protein
MHHFARNSAVRRLLRGLAMPVVLFFIVVLFNWKLVLTDQYTWLEGSDTAYQILPWFQFQMSEWHRFQFPLWEPYGWGGQPLLAQGQPGAAYPLNWLLFLFPSHGGWIRQDALHWYYVLIHYLAAVTAYALCRDLGRSRPASVLGACLYALGGYVGNTMWPQMLNGAVWTPLVFLFLFRVARGVRVWASSLLSGFFLGAGWLAGHHQMNLLVSIAAAGLWLWWIATGLAGRRFLLRWAAAWLAIAVAASAFQTLPMAEYAARAVRWVGSPEDPVREDQTVPYSVHERYALTPASLLGIVIPNVEKGSPPYVGVAGFTLALLGAALAWRSSREARWLASLAVGGVLYSLGPNSLLHGLLYSLAPLVDKARVAGAGTLILALGLAPLAAFGVDAVQESRSFRWTARAGWWLAGAGAVLTLAALLFFALRVETETGPRIMTPALAAFALAAVLAAWRSGTVSSTAGCAVLIGLALFELANVTNYEFPNRHIPEQNRYLRPLSQNWDLVNWVKSQGAAYRIDYDDRAIPHNLPNWWGLEALKQYSASVPENVWKMDLFSPRGQDFFGVRYYLGAAPNREGQAEVFQGASGLKVFENPTAYPRVWSVHRTAAVQDPAAAIANAEPDPLRTAFTSGPGLPELGECAAPDRDEVQMPLHAPNYVRIEARLACRGLVVLTDTYYPGWRATIDGRPARIHEVYGGVRGVVVDAGEHVIEMRFRPASVLAGFLLSLAAAAAAAGAWFNIAGRWRWAYPRTARTR